MREYKGQKIVTEHVYPPIPTRAFDWCATLDGYEPGDAKGTGATEEEAVNELIEILEDRDEAKLAATAKAIEEMFTRPYPRPVTLLTTIAGTDREWEFDECTGPIALRLGLDLAKLDHGVTLMAPAECLHKWFQEEGFTTLADTDNLDRDGAIYERRADGLIAAAYPDEAHIGLDPVSAQARYWERVADRQADAYVQ